MLLQLEHIYKTYGEGQLAVPVLKDINFHVKEGDYIAIMGLFVFIGHYLSEGLKRIRK